MRTEQLKMLPGGSAVVQAAEQTGKFAQQTGAAIAQTISSLFPFGVADGGVVSGPAAAAGAGTAAAAVGGMTAAEIVAIVTAGIALAGAIVPPLLDIAKGAMPAPNPGGMAESVASTGPGGPMQLAEGAMNPAAWEQSKLVSGEQDKILGLPRGVAYALGGAAVLGSGYAAYKVATGGR